MKAVLFALAVFGATYVLGDDDQLRYIQDSLNKMINLVDQTHKTQVDLIKNTAYLKLSSQMMKWHLASANVVDSALMTTKWRELKDELVSTKNTIGQGLNDTQIDVIMDHVLTGSNSSVYNILYNADKVMIAVNEKIASLNLKKSSE